VVAGEAVPALPGEAPATTAGLAALEAVDAAWMMTRLRKRIYSPLSTRPGPAVMPCGARRRPCIVRGLTVLLPAAALWWWAWTLAAAREWCPVSIE
jgi:hypothetical protein